MTYIANIQVNQQTQHNSPVSNSNMVIDVIDILLYHGIKLLGYHTRREVT